MYAAERRPGLERPFRAGFGLETVGEMKAQLERKSSIEPATVRLLSPQELAISEGMVGSGAVLTARLHAAHPTFGSERPERRLYRREVDMGNDRDLFADSGLALFEGRMVAPYDYRAKKWISGRGRAAVWNELPFESQSKSISPQWHVRQDDVPEGLRKRIQGYRIGFCNVTSPQTESPFAGAVIPPGVLCGHSVPTITFAESHWWMLPAWLAVAHSLPVNFLARRRVGLHFSYNILDSLPFPVWTTSDHADVRSLTPVAADLALVGPEMQPYREQLSVFGLCAPNEPDDAGRLLSRVRRAAALQGYVMRHVFSLDPTEIELLIEESAVAWVGEERRVGKSETPNEIRQYLEAGAPSDLSEWLLAAYG